MTALATWLLVVAVCDLLRASRDTITGRHRVILVTLGTTLLLLGGLWLDLPARSWLTLWPLWLLGLVGWQVCSSLALDPTTPGRSRWRAGAFASLAGAVGLLTLVVDAAAMEPTLPEPLDDSLLGFLGPPQALVVIGVLLTQLSTANVAVRLLLDAVGVPAVTHEKQLKGGRILGPMERLFLLGLGLAGSLGAAAVVVAAKGLLRYPELRRAEGETAATDVSEYFLIGSFASWLLALAGLGVVVLSEGMAA
jgi:hypothetical protein